MELRKTDREVRKRCLGKRWDEIGRKRTVRLKKIGVVGMVNEAGSR